MVAPSQALSQSCSMTEAPRHAFTGRIYEILARYFGDVAHDVFAQSLTVNTWGMTAPGA